MRRVLGLALLVLACRPAAHVEPPRVAPDAAPPTAPPFESIPPVFTDVTSSKTAACAQYQAQYRCWGDHPAFGAMVGATDGATVLEQPRVVDGHGTLRRLALGAYDAWALTDRGEVILWSNRSTHLPQPRYEAWKPALGDDIRDLAVGDRWICVRGAENVRCWSWRVAPDERFFADGGSVVLGNAAAGRLLAGRRGLEIETDRGCLRFDDRFEANDPGELSPAPCGALSPALLEDENLPPATDARERGACLLIEGVRLHCLQSTDARAGTYWTRTPRPRPPDDDDAEEGPDGKPALRKKNLVIDHGGREITRDAKGKLVARTGGRVVPLHPDDPVVRFVASDAWVELADFGVLLCGRTAKGVVGCTFAGRVHARAPIGLTGDPAFARPPLPFAATSIFVRGSMCAASANAEVLCWGPSPRLDDDRIRTDVTDRVIAASRDG